MLCLVLLTATLGAQEPPWKAIKSWNGSSDIKETESFTTTEREWRIKWTAKTNSETAIVRDFGAYVHSSADDKLVSQFKAGRTQTYGESYVRGTGSFYLKIGSFNVTWTITVEEPQ
jgi:hypothetical protein